MGSGYSLLYLGARSSGGATQEIARPHAHAHYEFCLVVEGSFLYTVDERTQVMGVGDLCLTKPGDLHSLSATGDDWRLYYAGIDSISTDTLASSFRACEMRCIEGCADIVPLFTSMLSELRRSELAAPFVVHHLMSVCLYKIARHVGRSQSNVRAPSMSEAVVKARAYIEESACHRLSLEGVARFTGMSLSRLAHKFADETGVPIYGYVRRMLMSRAARLLEDSSQTVSEVAEQLGLNSLQYFSAAFKAYWGLSPREYRRKHLSGGRV